MSFNKKQDQNTIKLVKLEKNMDKIRVINDI